MSFTFTKCFCNIEKCKINKAFRSPVIFGSTGFLKVYGSSFCKILSNCLEIENNYIGLVYSGNGITLSSSCLIKGCVFKDINGDAIKCEVGSFSFIFEKCDFLRCFRALYIITNHINSSYLCINKCGAINYYNSIYLKSTTANMFFSMITIHNCPNDKKNPFTDDNCQLTGRISAISCLNSTNNIASDSDAIMIYQAKNDKTFRWFTIFNSTGKRSIELCHIEGTTIMEYGNIINCINNHSIGITNHTQLLILSNIISFQTGYCLQIKSNVNYIVSQLYSNSNSNQIVGVITILSPISTFHITHLNTHQCAGVNFTKRIETMPLYPRKYLMNLFTHIYITCLVQVPGTG